VQHTFSLGATMPLANLFLQDKRFMYLDEYNMVEYASFPAKSPTIPKTMQLKLFSGQRLEITVSQSFQNGMPDVRWTRGVAMTMKLKGLWEPTSVVSAEDICHFRSRVEQFNATEVVTGKLKDTTKCKECFCQWVVQGASAWALRSGSPLPTLGGNAASVSESGRHGVEGLAAFLASASLPQAVSQKLAEDVVALGAVRVSELTRADWEGLASWGSLRPLEQRRLLAQLP